LCSFNEDAECDTGMYQFGFKKGHSTGTCTSIVKRTVDYYLKHGSRVFTYFIDVSKAFDRVNYRKLFLQMLEEGTNACFVSLLAFWYSNQIICVAWEGCYSDKFMVGNGIRQGGVLSPYLLLVMFGHYFLPYHKVDMDVTLVG